MVVWRVEGKRGREGRSAFQGEGGGEDRDSTVVVLPVRHARLDGMKRSGNVN